MPTIHPEPAPVGDPSDPRWTPPPGNRIDVPGPATPVDGEVVEG